MAKWVVLASLSVGLNACGAGPLPVPVSQAQAVSESKAAAQAKALAPQAFAEAEQLRAEAEFLHTEGRKSESSAAGEQSLAAYNEAFALSQMSEAEERLSRAQVEKDAAAQELKRLDLLQSQVEKDAEAFEMQARVVMDTEPVKDVDQPTAARIEARRLAAKHLAAEAGLLCLGAELLTRSTDSLKDTRAQLTTLDRELAVGSVKVDLFPRAADLRAACLQELTLARRPVAQKAPQSFESDALFTSISEAGKFMVYRDDRGVVINVGQPLAPGSTTQLSDFAVEALTFLGATAKHYKNYPLLLVVHTKKRGEEKRAAALGELAQAALLSAGAPRCTVRSVDNAQPVVHASVQGGNEKNERLEVVFVTPGR